MTNPGKGYGSVPTIDIGDSSRMVLKHEQRGSKIDGEITSVTIDNGGEGYQSRFRCNISKSTRCRR